MTRAILLIAFLMMEPARPASSQEPPRDLNKAGDERRIAAPAGTLSKASGEPRPIQLSLIDGTDIRFARVSTADGLSQTKVGQIVQDDQGFMWFGTQYGLNRYDGYNFKVFAHDPGNPNSFSGVYIRSLFKDRDGVTCGIRPLPS